MSGKGEVQTGLTKEVGEHTVRGGEVDTRPKKGWGLSELCSGRIKR